MCLYRVTEQSAARTFEGIGYKVMFAYYDSNLCTSTRRFPIATGEWVEREQDWPDWSIRATTGNSLVDAYYNQGFHCFINKHDAELYRDAYSRGDIVVEVHYRKGHTKGTQDVITGDHTVYVQCVVADEIFIEKGEPDVNI